MLLYDGEELVGAKQNRILNVSVLVAAGAKPPIPVSCVEQGRWARRSAEFSAALHVSTFEAHAARMRALEDALALLWPKRRAGYLLDALERLDGRATSLGRVAAFVDSVGEARVTRGPSAGGQDLRLRANGVIGSGARARRRDDPDGGGHEQGRGRARSVGLRGRVNGADAHPMRGAGRAALCPPLQRHLK